MLGVYYPGQAYPGRAPNYPAVIFTPGSVTLRGSASALIAMSGSGVSTFALRGSSFALVSVGGSYRPSSALTGNAADTITLTGNRE